MHKLRKREALITDINMIPFIDIVLVLLVVFMITAPLIMQGVKIHLPETSSKPLKTLKKEIITIIVGENGECFLETKEKTDKNISLESIAKRISVAKKQNPELVVLIKGDYRVHYGRIAKVMSYLQDIGIQDIGLITVPQKVKK